MLRARFTYVGEIRYGNERWLDCQSMAGEIRRARSTHLALREHWDDSAPMLFPDASLGLLEVTPEVSDDLTYLVWQPNHDEPQIWRYCGRNTTKFEHLAEYLQ